MKFLMKPHKRLAKNNKAVSVIEIIVTALILTFVAAGGAGFISYTKSTIIRSGNILQAMVYATAKTEELCNDDYDSVSSQEENSLPSCDFKDKYQGQRTHTITEMYWNGSAVDEDDIGTGVEDYIVISVTTSWDDNASPVTIKTIRKKS
jgi:hypothetical protein